MTRRVCISLWLCVFLCSTGVFFLLFFFFFFSSRRRHTRCSRDWSSDVCSSDLDRREEHRAGSASLGAASSCPHFVRARRLESRSEERRVGKECRSRWSPYH